MRILRIVAGMLRLFHANVEEQFAYLPGDLRTEDFGDGRFDLAILGNIVHSEEERFSRELTTNNPQ